MKISVCTLGVVGLLASSASAIELDITNKESIKKAASVAAAGLRLWYTGDRVGDTPGNLPDPYYWWECGAMFNGFIDYWYYTGDSQYNNITTQGMVHQIGSANAFEPVNQTKTLGNDDQAFWAMAAMTAAETNFPDAEGSPSWLTLVQAVFNRQASRWDTKTCGGGLKWQMFSFNNGYNYKNTISNGCFFSMAARLAKYTGNETYSNWAVKAWDWERSVGLMSQDYHFYDGTDDRQNCSTVNHIEWSYNAGVHLAGAAAMWNITQSEDWKERLTGLISATEVFYSTKVKNVMVEVACENGGNCNVDQRSFKAYLSRWMGYSMKVAPWTIPLLLPKLQTSAAAAAKQCNAGLNQTTCGLKWTDNGVNDGSFGVGEQMAAMEVIHNLLIDEVAGPVSADNGGTSVGDPTAGGDDTEPGPTFDPISTGDRAGAGIVTTLVLIGILGGAWFLLH